MQIRYGDFVREVSLAQNAVNYNDLVPKIEVDADGNEIPYKPPKLQLKGGDIYRLLTPYVSVRFLEQVKAVVPLALYLVLFQLVILRQGVTDSWIITGGLVAVIVGLMVFMEGLKLGLMPFGETIGHQLPQRSPLYMVLLVAFLLGVGVTFAEPAIGALKQAGKQVDPNSAPYLWALLNIWSDTLVLMVGMGVGLATVLGTMRFIFGWSLKPFIYLSVVPTLLLTSYIMMQPDLSVILGLAWDCGAVTTGPVTVPLVLALGIGVAGAAGKGDSSLSGFGIVTLASVFPIVGVMVLGTYVWITVSPDQIVEQAKAIAETATAGTSWLSSTPGQEIVGGIQAIVPLVIFLVLVLKLVLRQKMREVGIIAYGITLCVLGMIIFNLGLSYGLAKLGGQSGAIVPASFKVLEAIEQSPLYAYGLGIAISVAFAWFMGFGATLAEPALNALGMTIENLTNGAFRKSMLMYSVSLGVGCGIALGVCKIIFNIPLAYLILPLYALALVLTWLSTEEFVNIAWDSAGVTTGPVTVPLVLAMGLGFGGAMQAVEGFGILSMASIGPILAVLTCGLYVQFKAKRSRQAKRADAELAAGPASASVTITPVHDTNP